MPIRLRALRKRFPTTVRRLRITALFLLLLGGGALLAGRLLGPGETDVARELTGVTDAAAPPEVTIPRADRPVTRARSGEDACAVMVEAVPAHAAMVGLAVTAPCDGGGRVDIVQDALAITLKLDADGQATATVPALSSAPLIAVMLADTPPVLLQTWVADFDRYQRAVLQWGGQSGLLLHAFEGEAEWGGAGHVGPDAPRDVGYAVAGEGGFLVRLGDSGVTDGLGALVYTAPAGISAALTLEAPVTSESCGRDIDAAAFRIGPGQSAEPRAVTMTVPGCQAVGDSVLIEGVLEAVSAGLH